MQQFGQKLTLAGKKLPLILASKSNEYLDFILLLRLKTA